MGVSIIVGGQFGSEGKGKVAYWFANQINAAAVVRVGGINSGHTVVDSNGMCHIFRVLPTATIDNNKKYILPAGSYIDLDILAQEIRRSGVDQKNILIDPNAVIISQLHIINERSCESLLKIGSTLSGTGSAVSMRVNRNTDITFAKDIPSISSFICDTSKYMRNILDNGEEIVIEGTQGFGLSNLHTPYYPYATSRDTSAAGFLSETGLSPLDVNNIIMVIRAFPIRVSGNSGPLPKETTWEDVTALSGQDKAIREYTSVTNQLRRVACFDSEIVNRAIIANKPNIIILNHLDYIGENNSELLGKNRRSFIESIESQIINKIDYVGLDNRSVLKI